MASYNSGADNGRAKLGPRQVEDVRRLFLSGQIRITDVSKAFRISKSSATRIIGCDSWRSVWPCTDEHEEQEYMSRIEAVKDGKKTAKVRHERAVEIIMRVHAGECQSDLSSEYGIARVNVNSIVHGVHHQLAYREAMMRIRRGESWQ